MVTEPFFLIEFDLVAQSRPLPASRACAEIDDVVVVDGRHRRPSEKCGQANRLVSTGQLNALLRLHHPPINLVVYQEPNWDALSWSWLPA